MNSADYSPLVRELFSSAKAEDELKPQGGEWVLGEAGSVANGTWVRFALRIDRGRVTEARFKAYGCPHTLAAAACFAAQARGSALDQVPAEGARQVAGRLEVPPEKLGRLLIVEDAMRACRRQARGAV